MENYKGKLQEHFQKQSKPLPTYSTKRVDGCEDHISRFTSCVYLSDGTTYEGEVCASKREAEKSAAKKAFEELYSAASTPCALTTPRSNKFHIIILIDLENVQSANSYIPSQGETVYGFKGKCSTVKTDNTAYNIVIVDNVMTNAVDHFITFFAGGLSVHYENTPQDVCFIVVSRDKFAAITCACLQARGFEAKHITSL